jgi:hypothetical protein
MSTSAGRSLKGGTARSSATMQFTLLLLDNKNLMHPESIFQKWSRRDPFRSIHPTSGSSPEKRTGFLSDFRLTIFS